MSGAVTDQEVQAMSNFLSITDFRPADNHLPAARELALTNCVHTSLIRCAERFLHVAWKDRWVKGEMGGYTSMVPFAVHAPSGEYDVGPGPGPLSYNYYFDASRLSANLPDPHHIIRTSLDLRGAAKDMFQNLPAARNILRLLESCNVAGSSALHMLAAQSVGSTAHSQGPAASPTLTILDRLMLHCSHLYVQRRLRGCKHRKNNHIRVPSSEGDGGWTAWFARPTQTEDAFSRLVRTMLEDMAAHHGDAWHELKERMIQTATAGGSSGMQQAMEAMDVRTFMSFTVSALVISGQTLAALHYGYLVVQEWDKLTTEDATVAVAMGGTLVHRGWQFAGRGKRPWTDMQAALHSAQELLSAVCWLMTFGEHGRAMAERLEHTRTVQAYGLILDNPLMSIFSQTPLLAICSLFAVVAKWVQWTQRLFQRQFASEVMWDAVYFMTQFGPYAFVTLFGSMNMLTDMQSPAQWLETGGHVDSDALLRSAKGLLSSEGGLMSKLDWKDGLGKAWVLSTLHMTASALRPRPGRRLANGVGQVLDAIGVTWHHHVLATTSGAQKVGEWLLQASAKYSGTELATETKGLTENVKKYNYIAAILSEVAGGANLLEQVGISEKSGKSVTLIENILGRLHAEQRDQNAPQQSSAAARAATAVWLAALSGYLQDEGRCAAWIRWGVHPDTIRLLRSPDQTTSVFKIFFSEAAFAEMISAGYFSDYIRSGGPLTYSVRALRHWWWPETLAMA